MQFVGRGDRPDAFADGGAGRAGNPHDYLAGRQFSGIGGNALHLVLATTIDKGFGPDVLDCINREVERDAADNRFALNEKVLGTNPHQTGVVRRVVIGELRFDFARPQRQQIHRRCADE